MRRPISMVGYGVVLLTLVLSMPNTPRQTGPAQTALPLPNSSQQKSAQQQSNAAPTSKIRTQVNEITTPVTIVDRKGNFVLDVPEKDFHVFDNGVEQHIDRWGLDDHPLALALVIETSSHVAVMARTIHRASIVFTQVVMALSGEAAVISYGDSVDIRQGFTRDHDAVEKAIEGLKFNTDGMRLYDGMWEGAQLLEKEPADCHRVLLVIGEAQNGGSKHKLDDVLEEAQKANISIYTIGLSSTAADLREDPVPHDPDDDLGVTSGGNPVPDATTGTPEGVGGAGCLLCVAIWLVQRATHEKKNHAMEAAVTSTGGAYYHPFKDHTIAHALDEIGNELHSQYVLSYQLQGEAQPGVHEIEVRISRPHVKVRSRLGYYVARPIR